MEIIFIKNVKGQGNVGDIKTVKDGYGAFLIKNNSAILKTKENLVKLEKTKALKEAEIEQEKEDALKLKDKLAKVTLEFKVKTGDHDKVFGSVSAKQIKDELTKLGYNIPKTAIELNIAISTLGFHDVTINLYQDIKTTIKVHVIK
jgi:large subunit ribosomal protein L9